MRVDHLVPDEVRALVERIDDEQGALHVLVNDIWGATTMEWDKTVWESDARRRAAHAAAGVDTHAITSHFALPLLIRDAGRPGRRGDRRDRRVQRHELPRVVLLRPRQGGRPAAWRSRWRTSSSRTARPRSSLTPGWLRSEAMLEAYGVTEANWRDATEAHPPLRHLREPRASSAGPSRRSRRIPTSRAGTAQSLSSGQLAKVYGFTDLDGSQPDAWRYLVEVQDAGQARRHHRLSLTGRSAEPGQHEIGGSQHQLSRRRRACRRPG